MITTISKKPIARAFWAMGIYNNISYVIMIACAKSISEGGIALIFLANIVPGLLIAISAPYWFDKISYDTRLAISTKLMFLSFLIVAIFSRSTSVITANANSNTVVDSNSISSMKNINSQELSILHSDEHDENKDHHLPFHVMMQLFGVALISVQSTLGEISLLALAGKFDSISDRYNHNRSHIGIHQNMQIDNSVHNQNDRDEEHIISEIQQQFKTLLPIHENNHLNIATNMNDESSCYSSEKNTNNRNIYFMKPICVASYSSGTGIAGILGFAFVFVFTKVAKLSLSWVLFIAMVVFPISYWKVYSNIIREAYDHDESNYSPTDFMLNEIHEKIESTLDDDRSQDSHYDCHHRYNYHSSGAVNFDIIESSVNENFAHLQQQTVDLDVLPDIANYANDKCIYSDSTVHNNTKPSSTNNIHHMSLLDRVRLFLSLWHYTIPFFTVYATEYALQSGVWTAIGFPVTDLKARNSFYVASNWMYQIGVFISRSSGIFFTVPLSILWLMPILQLFNLIFFYHIATEHDWYNYSLLFICLFVGLLGGAVYVHGYARINRDLDPSITEFAFSTVGISGYLGIVVADVAGLYIQSCLYDANGISGAIVSCPVS